MGRPCLFSFLPLPLPVPLTPSSSSSPSLQVVLVAVVIIDPVLVPLCPPPVYVTTTPALIAIVISPPIRSSVRLVRGIYWLPPMGVELQPVLFGALIGL